MNVRMNWNGSDDDEIDDYLWIWTWNVIVIWICGGCDDDVICVVFDVSYFVVADRMNGVRNVNVYWWRKGT